MERLHNPINHSNSASTFITDATSNQRKSSLSEISSSIITTLLKGYHGDTAVELWDGQRVMGDDNAKCCIIFHEPAVIRELILYRSLSRLTEAYLSGAVSVKGDMEVLFDLSDHLDKLSLSWNQKWHLIWLALKLPNHYKKIKPLKNRTGHKNGRASIAHHYDVSNEFYKLWLDPKMVYTCAYFRDEKQSLAQAQIEKLDYLCRKLRLKPGQTLLDIGCGWGALAIHAAKKYGVKVHGITLSKNQQLAAQKKVIDEGLEDQVNIELCDYRNLPDDAQYDRVVSVGMFEHIGIKNFPVYFDVVKRVLKRGGLFLNHGITNDTGWQNTPVTRFINRYIFPDGELARVSDVSDAMEKAGFEVLDMESLRRHYSYTLRHWVKSLEENYDEAIQQTSEVTYRLWRLYMAGSAYYFNQGSIGVSQLLVGHLYDPVPVPLRRDDLYID